MTTAERAERIDTAALLAGVDLLALIGADTELHRVATTRGGEWAGPCPACGGTDRLRVQPAQGQWMCRACHNDGGKWDDAIGYVRWRDGVSFREACLRLGADSGALVTTTTRLRPVPARPVPPEPTVPDAVWRERAESFVARCEAALWSPSGAWARGYLREWRGLSESTLRRWRLGWRVDPKGWGTGVTIPWYAAGELWQVKTRRLRPGQPYAQAEAVGAPKYISVTGGHPLLFGADALAGHTVGVLTEGEFDAMLVAQEAGDLIGVATLGSAGKEVPTGALRFLLPLGTILAAYDADDAGQRGAAKLLAMSARVRPVPVPNGKDLTEFFRRGGDVRAWAVEAFYAGSRALAPAEVAELDALPEVRLIGTDTPQPETCPAGHDISAFSPEGAPLCDEPGCPHRATGA
jgi:DNA primase